MTHRRNQKLVITTGASAGVGAACAHAPVRTRLYESGRKTKENYRARTR
jgi:NADP-dependent 3-hydroxy acid dehydrogenase YdfG